MCINRISAKQTAIDYEPRRQTERSGGTAENIRVNDAVSGTTGHIQNTGRGAMATAVADRRITISRNNDTNDGPEAALAA